MTKAFQVVAAHGFIKKGNKYLVIRRSQANDYKPGEWDIPGGTIEIGETPNDALMREIKEESSLEVIMTKPLFVCSDFQGGIRHQFWIVYECKYISGEVKLNPEEHDDYRWVSASELGKLDNISFLKKLYNDILK